MASRLEALVLYNSRDPRAGERDGVDYHFRTRKQMETFRDNAQYALLDVRGDLQAFELEQLRSFLKSGDVLFEGNPLSARRC